MEFNEFFFVLFVHIAGSEVDGEDDGEEDGDFEEEDDDEEEENGDVSLSAVNTDL